MSATWRDIAAAIESKAPLALQEDYDNSGLQVEGTNREVTDVLLTLDITPEVVMEAAQLGAQMVVSHHPLLFRPLRRVTKCDYISDAVRAAILNDITLYSAHTNLDNAPEGVNTMLAQVLEIEGCEPLVPLPADRLERSGLDAAERQRCGSGVIGHLAEPIDIEGFTNLVRSRLRTPSIKYNTDYVGKIKTVALCGGAGASFIGAAERKHADAYVTGEVGYHPFFGHPNMLIVEAGHFETEQYTVQLLHKLISKHYPEINYHESRHSESPTKTL